MKSLMICLFALLSMGRLAQADMFEYAASGTPDSDGPGDATATVTTGAGSITVTLTDLQQNPRAAGQLISGISFDASGATGTSGSLSSSSGNTSTIASDGSYSTAVLTSPLTHWSASQSDTAIHLTTLSGGMPNTMIIGPDSAGGFTGAGTYSNANASIINFNPNVLGSATFVISAPGVTSASTLSNVVFEFGTGPDGTLPGSPVPEPKEVVALLSLFGLAGVGLIVGRRRRCC